VALRVVKPGRGAITRRNFVERALQGEASLERGTCCGGPRQLQRGFRPMSAETRRLSEKVVTHYRILEQ
jgi:hypothetical protein